MELTSVLDIKIVDSPSEAENYNERKTPITGLTVKSAIVVGGGMESGAPSVDLLMVDDEGNDYLVMASGGIIEMLAGAVKGKRERDELLKHQKEETAGQYPGGKVN